MIRQLLRLIHSGRVADRAVEGFFTPPAFAALARLTRFCGAPPPTADEAYAILSAAEDELVVTDSPEIRLELARAIHACVAAEAHVEQRGAWYERARHHLETGIALAEEDGGEHSSLEELRAELARQPVCDAATLRAEVRGFCRDGRIAEARQAAWRLAALAAATPDDRRMLRRLAVARRG